MTWRARLRGASAAGFGIMCGSEPGVQLQGKERTMPDCNEEDIAILRDGVFVHEAEVICRRLEKAGIQFGVRQVSQEDAGIVDPRKDNWASGLCTVVNYFNRGGLSVYVRICVRSEDVERANEILAERPRKAAEADGRHYGRRADSRRPCRFSLRVFVHRSASQERPVPLDIPHRLAPEGDHKMKTGIMIVALDNKLLYRGCSPMPSPDG